MGYITGSGGGRSGGGGAPAGGGGTYVTGGRPFGLQTAEGDVVGEAEYSAKLNQNKRDFVQQLKRLGESGANADVQRLLRENRGAFTDQELRDFGLYELATTKLELKNDTGGPIGSAFRFGDTITGGGLSTAMDLLDRPAQYAKLTLGELKQGHYKAAGGAALAAVPKPGNWDAPLEFWTSDEDLKRRVAESGLDQDGDGRLGNLREALGKDMNAGGRLVGAFDFVGSAATDPVTYVSAGGGSLAKASLKQISLEMGDDVARTIRQYGLKNAVKKGLISEVEQEAIRNTLRRSAEELVQNAAAKRSVRRLVAREGEEAAAERLAARSMTAVERSGRSGLRIGAPIGDGSGNITAIPSRPFGLSIPGLQAKYAPRVAATASAVEDVTDVAPARNAVVDAIPAATEAYDTEAAQMMLQAADLTAPKAADDVVRVSVDGSEQFIYRDAEGRARAILSIADGKVEELFKDPALAEKGISRRLYAAADEAGLDVANLSADEMTAAGRAARESYLRGAAPAGEVLPHPRDIQFQGGDPFTEDFTFLGAADDGKDVFIRVNADDQLIPFIRNPKRIKVQPGDADGAAKGFTGGERAGSVPLSEIEKGDRIPGVGLVRQVSDDGILRIFPDPAVRPPGADRWTLFPEGSAAARNAEEAAPEAVTPLRGGRGASDPIRRSLAGVLRESRPGQSLRKAFIPRAAIRDSLGETAAQKVYEAVEQASAAGGRSVNDMLLQIGKVSEKAAKELGDGAGRALADAVPAIQGKSGYDAFNDLALGTLEGTLDLPTVRAALLEDGMENAVKALDAFADVAKRSADAIQVAKGADTGALVNATKGRISGQSTTIHGGEEYADDLFGTNTAAAPAAGVPRILTKEGEALAKGDRSLRLGELLGVDSGALRQGEDLSAYVNKVRPDAGGAASYADQTVREVNADLAQRLGLPPEVKLFEDDAMAAVALRGKSAFEASAQTNLYESLARETVDGKNPMMLIVRPGDSSLKKAQLRKQAEDNGWKRLKPNGKDPVIGEAYAHPDIADEVAKVQDMLINDESLKQMAQFLQKWNGVWASYATVPIVFGTGFHSRNSIGNVILSFMGGLTNPVRYAEAADLQWHVGRTRALMKKEGISWEEALPKAVKSKRSRALIEDMRNHGVISNGFFADISGDEVENLLRHNSLKDWMKPKKIPARLGDNATIRWGRKVGDVVENNARVALYLDAFGKTGSVQQAANTVKKYLFDYNDLTPFERRYMKSLNRFYTFTRKNVAVQLYTMAMDPWRIKMVSQAEGALFDGAETDAAPLPEYARRGGFNIAGILGKPQGTEGVAMNIDTPLDNAIKTLDPLAQAVSMVPGIRNIVPPQYRSDKMQLTKSVLNLRAGGPVEMVNFLFEEATGKDTFSGKDISKEGSGDTFKRLSAVFSPLYAKGAGQVEDPIWQNNLGMDLRLSLLQTLVGIDVLPITDKQKNQVAYVGAQEAENTIARLREQGIDVPTYTELVAAGLAPDMTTPREGKRRSASEAAAARFEKINAARNALGASPIQEPAPTGSQRKRYI